MNIETPRQAEVVLKGIGVNVGFRRLPRANLGSTDLQDMPATPVEDRFSEPRIMRNCRLFSFIGTSKVHVDLVL